MRRRTSAPDRRNVWWRGVPPALLSMAAFWVPWIMWQHPSARSLVYNVPISLAFFVLGWEMVLSGAPRPYWIVWTLGVAQIIARTLFWFPASAHIVWCVLMMMQARRRNAPRWVHGYVALVFVQSAVFKIVLGGVVGGLSGVAFGVALVWLLDVLLRRDVLAASSVNDP